MVHSNNNFKCNVNVSCYIFKSNQVKYLKVWTINFHQVKSYYYIRNISTVYSYYFYYSKEFWNLNKVSLKDHYPLPKMDYILQKVVGSQKMSMLDGFSRYNQIMVHPDDREKTTFTTPWGTFMYVKMSFYLMNVGATFQR